MASAVQIANMALTQIGADTITALSEDSEAARLCNVRFDDVRDAVLRAHPWNCALARAQLAQEQAAPVFGFSFQYALPADPYCLRVLALEQERSPFKIEGRKLLTDDGTVKVLYIARITDTEQFDPLLVQALAVRLGHEIAYRLTSSSRQAEAMWELYREKLREARAVDAQEGTPDSILADEFLLARL